MTSGFPRETLVFSYVADPVSSGTLPHQFAPRTGIVPRTFDTHDLHQPAIDHATAMRLRRRPDRTSNEDELVIVDVSSERHRAARAVDNSRCDSVERITHFCSRTAKFSANLGRPHEDDTRAIALDLQDSVIHESINIGSRVVGSCSSMGQPLVESSLFDEFPRSNPQLVGAGHLQFLRSGSMTETYTPRRPLCETSACL